MSVVVSSVVVSVAETPVVVVVIPVVAVVVPVSELVASVLSPVLSLVSAVVIVVDPVALSLAVTVTVDVAVASFIEVSSPLHPVSARRASKGRLWIIFMGMAGGLQLDVDSTTTATSWALARSTRHAPSLRSPLHEGPPPRILRTVLGRCRRAPPPRAAHARPCTSGAG
jgi:hypothetical protein